MKRQRHPGGAGQQQRVFWLGAPSPLLDALGPLLDAASVRLDLYAHTTELTRAAAEHAPTVIVLDMDTLQLDAVEIDVVLPPLLQELASVGVSRRPAILGLACEEAGATLMSRRVAALRAGMTSYLPGIVDPQRLAQRIQRLCGAIEPLRYRVAIVETDREQAAKIRAVLAHAGMEPRLLSDPMHLLEQLEVTRPHLLLLALDLPGVSGAELAAILRDHDAFFGIPILYLATEPALDVQLAALKAGGDGFIRKPISSRKLIAAVEQRMRRSRWLQDRRTLHNRREAASGFLPREVFQRHLERLFVSGAPMAAGDAVYTIDLAVETVLAQLGIGGTERLLRRCEQALGALLRADESATRWDDFRYAVLARRQDSRQLQLLGRDIQERLLAAASSADAAAPQPAIAIGVAPFLPFAESLDRLLERGRAAAAAAAEAGDGLRFWTPSGVAERPTESALLIQHLVATAIAQDGFQLLYQPILAVGEECKELYEVQLRLPTSPGEVLAPSDFLPAAAHGGQLSALDRWVLRRALEVVAAERAHLARLNLMVHQTLATLAEPEWFSWLREQAVAVELERGYPLLSFHMADLIENQVPAKSLIERLRAYGFPVCADNTYGAKDDLQRLAHLGVRFAKLAYGAVRELSQDQLRQVLSALRERGISVIVPGIDDPTLAAQVWGAGPSFIQGDFLRAPSARLDFDFEQFWAGG